MSVFSLLKRIVKMTKVEKGRHSLWGFLLYAKEKHRERAG